MRATRRPAARGAVALRRGVFRGSLLGLGLLVATGATAPAALADEGAEGAGGAPESRPDAGLDLRAAPLNEVPAQSTSAAVSADFGNGKDPVEGHEVSLSLVSSGAAPRDLDYSGATFKLTKMNDSRTTATCVTDRTGTCTVQRETEKNKSRNGTTVYLPSGEYRVAQTAGVPGLLRPDGNLGTFELCGSWDWFCDDSGSATFPNDSLFRRAVHTTVVVGGSQTTIGGVPYELKGPNYPRRSGAGATREPGGTGTVYDAGWKNSDPHGVVKHTPGYFLPGTWTLTPGTPPAGFLPGTAGTVDIVTTTKSAAASPFAARAALQPVPAPEPEPEPEPLPGLGTIALTTNGPVPDGLDISGVEFLLTDDAETAATCVTGLDGRCSVVTVPDGEETDLPGTGAAEIALPAGTYTVEQIGAVPGLLPADEIEPLTVCSSAVAEECQPVVTVQNESLFRTSVVASLSGGGEAADGVELALSGPSYPVLPAGDETDVLRSDAAVAIVVDGDGDGDGDAAGAPGYDAGTAVTDSDGIASWEGWFIPGTWSFGATGRSLVQADHDLVTQPVRSLERAPWEVTLELVPTADPDPEPGPQPQPQPQPQPGPDNGTGGNPGTNGNPVVPNGPAANAGTGPVAGAAAGAGAGTGTGAGTDTAAQEQTPLPTAPSGSPSTAPPTTGGGSPTGGTADDLPQSAELETAAGGEVLTAGLAFGIGVVFLGIVGFGFLWLRRRARREV